MFDNITVASLPVGADAYAGYLPPSSWPNYPNIVARFPHTPVLSIAVSSTAKGHCLDVENGDATNATCVQWFKRGNAVGPKPFVYTSIANAAALCSVLAANAIPRTDYYLWTAHYNGRSHLCTPACGFGNVYADGTQWTDQGPGGCDESLISTAFLAGILGTAPVAPTPVTPTPAVSAPEENAMIVPAGHVAIVRTTPGQSVSIAYAPGGFQPAWNSAGVDVHIAVRQTNGTFTPVAPGKEGVPGDPEMFYIPAGAEEVLTAPSTMVVVGNHAAKEDVTVTNLG